MARWDFLDFGSSNSNLSIDLPSQAAAPVYVTETAGTVSLQIREPCVAELTGENDEDP